MCFLYYVFLRLTSQVIFQQIPQQHEKDVGLGIRQSITNVNKLINKLFTEYCSSYYFVSKHSMVGREEDGDSPFICLLQYCGWKSFLCIVRELTNMTPMWWILISPLHWLSAPTSSSIMLEKVKLRIFSIAVVGMVEIAIILNRSPENSRVYIP